MSTFNTAPDFSAQKVSRPTVSKVQFGDGYQQRVAHGINTNLKTWNLKFSARTDEEADEIEEFFDEHGGVDAFGWTPPGADEESNFICTEWQRTLDAFNVNTITCVFEEVAEP